MSDPKQKVTPTQPARDPFKPIPWETPTHVYNPDSKTIEKLPAKK